MKRVCAINLDNEKLVEDNTTFFSENTKYKFQKSTNHINFLETKQKVKDADGFYKQITNYNMKIKKNFTQVDDYVNFDFKQNKTDNNIKEEKKISQVKTDQKDKDIQSVINIARTGSLFG